jgi:hypothetical protein
MGVSGAFLPFWWFLALADFVEIYGFCPLCPFLLGDLVVRVRARDWNVLVCPFRPGISIVARFLDCCHSLSGWHVILA